MKYVVVFSFLGDSFYWINLLNAFYYQLNKQKINEIIYGLDLNKKYDLKVSYINQAKYENFVIAIYKFKIYIFNILLILTLKVYVEIKLLPSNVLFEVEIWL